MARCGVPLPIGFPPAAVSGTSSGVQRVRARASRSATTADSSQRSPDARLIGIGATNLEITVCRKGIERTRRCAPPRARPQDLAIGEAAQEVDRGLVSWVTQELLRRTLLDDPPLLHEHDAVGRLPAKCISWVTTIIVVPSCARSSMTRSTSPMSSGSRALSRLVEEEHLRLHAQRARDRHPLLLAAGEPRGVFVALVDQPDDLEEYSAADRLVVRMPRTRIGASMQLPRTVMCGKRANSWNSMAARSRIWRICSWCARDRALQRLRHRPSARRSRRSRLSAPRGSSGSAAGSSCRCPSGR